MAQEALIVFSMFPDADAARRIARVLVEERLAACANIFPQIESIYRWKGKIEETREVLLLIKTTIGKYQQLEQRIRALHSYEVPEIIALRLHDGLPDYLNWIEQSTQEG